MKRNALIFTLFMTCFMKVIAQPQFPFTASQANPVLEHGAPGAWDAAGMIDPDIVFDNGTYYLFYTGFETSGQGAIGYATSSDGYNFIKVTVSDPVFASDGTGFDAWLVSDPVIIKEGNLWVMYYGARQYAGPGPGPSIGKATANDLAGPWTREEDAILTVGSPGEWDSHFVIPNTILYTESGMVMYYSGAASLAGDWYMGMAYNNGSGWIKYDDPSTNVPPYAESDPVLITGEPGAWDSHIASFGYVNKIASGFEMFYLGETTSSAGLGYAISTDGIIWEKSPDNPFYTYLDDPFAASNNLYVLELPAVYITNDTYRMYYDYGTGSGTGYIGMATAPTLPQIIHVPADQPTIQAGIDIATTGDTVLVAEGTYYENINFLGKAITVGSHFMIDGNPGHIDNTIIDGSQPANPDYGSVVTFDSFEDTISVLYGFTITGGTGTLFPMDQSRSGGGILCYNAGAKIVHNVIISNQINHTGNTFGGGIALNSDGSEHLVVIQENSILNNITITTGEWAYGGGISSDLDTRIIDNLIANNSIDGNDAIGGGVRCNSSTGSNHIIIENNTINSNEINGRYIWGGGVGISGSSVVISGNQVNENIINCERGYGGGVRTAGTIGEFLMTNNEISGNSIFASDLGSGMGAYIHSPTAYTNISGNVFSNNSATGTSYGGGLRLNNSNGVDILVDGNIISDNNIPGAGGGVYINASNCRFLNNLVTNNSAGQSGGGIYLTITTKGDTKDKIWQGFMTDEPVSLDFTRNAIFYFMNNTFVENSADYSGGAIRVNYTTEHCEIINSIFWDNTANSGNDVHYSGTEEIYIDYCDINPANIAGSWTGSDNINTDPLFDLSGPHPYALMPNSPCIDTGTPDTTGLCLPVYDIIGCCRIWDGDDDGIAVIDMGAYEFDSPMVGIANPVVAKKETKLTTYPNPFHSSTTIEFELMVKTPVTLQVYNHMGQQVAELLNESRAKGQHQLTWNAAHLPRGFYFLHLQAGSEVRKGKVIKY